MSTQEVDLSEAIHSFIRSLFPFASLLSYFVFNSSTKLLKR